MVLPSGLKATLRTMPSFTASGSPTSRLRAATSHSTTPPPAAGIAVSGRDGLAVWAEGHARKPALFHGEWLVDQAFACGHVPQHHAARRAAGDAVSGRDGLAVGAEGHARNTALFHGEAVVDQPFACGHVPQHHAAAATEAVSGRDGLAVGLKATLEPCPLSRGVARRPGVCARPRPTAPRRRRRRCRIRPRWSCRRG